MGCGYFCEPSMCIASASGYGCLSWRWELLGRAEDLAVPWKATKWQWRVQRETGNRTVLAAKLGMPAGPAPTSWLQCAVGICGAAEEILWQEMTRGKSSRLPKSGGMAKAVRRQTGAGTRWVRKVPCPLICIAECYAQGEVVLQSILCVAALHTAGNLQCFQGHWTRQDALGHPGPFPATVGMPSFNPIVNWLIFILKAIESLPPHNSHWEAAPESHCLRVGRRLLITRLNVFMVSLHPLVPVPTFSFS